MKYEPSQTPSRVGYAQMKAVLQGLAVVADGASPAPGLGSAFQIGLQIVQKAEAAEKNKQICSDVAQHAYELLKAVNDMNLQNDTSLQEISNSLTQELKLVYDAISTFETRNTLGQVIHASGDKDAIHRCEKFLDKSLDRFLFKLQLLQYSKINGFRMTQPTRMPGKWPKPEIYPGANLHCSFEFSVQIPTLPSSFCGRTALVEQAKGIILNAKGANLAITGTGGIGHGDVLNIIDKEKKEKDPRKSLHDVLSASENMLVVLDNFETPWNEFGNRTHIHGVLKDIASLDNVTLIITTRVTVLPSGVYWQSFLPDDILSPLDIPSARAIFLQEARITVEGQELADLDVLLREVDCIPLAVSLLSRAQKSKSPTQLLKRWRHEQTVMLKEPGHSTSTRLDSVEVSIEVSLAPFKESDELKFLALLSFLPAGRLGLKDHNNL
ncbi:hypothetical protein AX17_004766 [Amanita inopinata Kibby_2008]|nr:hypothetical protein AX17_004766 [Amanita inopinata Kibby_2008]